MKSLSAKDLVEILGARLVAGTEGVMFNGKITTDTRKLSVGGLFCALKGEHFDGNCFAEAALKAGESIALVGAWSGQCPEGAAVLQVDDTLIALQRLAYWWRRQLNIPVIAITGSNGKTSTKDLICSVLSQGFQVSATKGNLNNHIGLPLTVLATTESDTAAVWEMGMNHAGELAPLCDIGKPRYGVITNIGTAHIEFLGTRDAIAEEKGTVARVLPSDGFLLIPDECDYREYLSGSTQAEVVTVGIGRGAIQAQQVVLEASNTHFQLVIDGVGSVAVELPVPGRHMVMNALLAAGIGWKMGLSMEQIARGLSGAVLTGGRLHCFECDGITVVDDTYNANPESMAAALDTLSMMPVDLGSRRFAVLGKMGELGIHAIDAHRKIGAYAAQLGLTVVAVGEGAEEIAEGAKGESKRSGAILYVAKLEDAAVWLRAELRPRDVVLFKGSRSATVEKVMHSIFPKK
jgi:UDP-N-acetylmuramoyl-tripeptide--D-alanyl-D-alanine ligase